MSASGAAATSRHARGRGAHRTLFRFSVGTCMMALQPFGYSTMKP
jgi:hypothetical protein